MGLRPEDLQRYTVLELNAMWKGFLWQRRQLTALLALQTFNNLSMLGNKNVTWEMIRDQFELAAGLPPREGS